MCQMPGWPRLLCASAPSWFTFLAQALLADATHYLASTIVLSGLELSRTIRRNFPF